MSGSSPNLRKVLRILTDTVDTNACCCYGWLNRGEQKMSLETHFFPFWEQTKNVLWATNGFNIDSLMGTKKMSAVFQNSCLSQSGVIVDVKVSNQHWQCCMPCRNIIGCKSSFTWYVLPGFCFLYCWVQFKVRSLSFWQWFCAIWHLQPVTALNLSFKCFSPKQFSASLKLCGDFLPNWSGCLPHLIVEWSVQQFSKTSL